MLLGAVNLVSCNIKEDMSDCPGYIILDYTAYSDEILDEIDSLSQVNIYIFDESDICFDIRTFTFGELQAQGYQFEMPITYMGLSVLVWQGHIHSDYDASSMQLGASLSDFYLRLNYSDDLVFGHKPAELWAGEKDEIEYCAAITRHRVYMTKIDTQVNISLYQRDDTGTTASLDMSNYLTTITAVADVYSGDFTISNQSQKISYDNSDLLLEASAVSVANIGTLRLDPSRESSLKIDNLTSGEPVELNGASEIDLVSYMLESRSDSSVADQTFLDLNKKWDISFTLDSDGSSVVSLTINGWVAWFDSADL